MNALVSSDIFLFAEFRLDRRGGGLLRCDDAGTFVPVAVGSRALDILGVLIERAGEVVSKDEIIAAVWPETVVDDSNLTVQISALRRVLDQGRSQGSYIQTVPGRGYRFVAAVTHPAAEARSSPTNSEAEHGKDGAPEPVVALPVSSMPITVSRRRRTASIAIAAAVGAALVLAVTAWWLWPTAKLSPTPEVAAATSIPRPLVAPRLSIVVLPFADLTGDSDQQYFVDGITDDLTTDLSKMSDSFVISRNTAFTYKNKLVDAKQIGRELGVRYVLEGSVRRSGNQVRINAQLIDAETDAQLWAERFDRDMGDLFDLQNEVASRLANTLGVELASRDAARPTERPDALDYILRGRAAAWKPWSRDNVAEAVGQFERALALDPRSVEAQTRLADLLAGRVLIGTSDSVGADLRACRRAGRPSPGSIAPLYPCAFRQRSSSARAKPMGGGHFRIRDCARVEPQHGWRIT